MRLFNLTFVESIIRFMNKRQKRIGISRKGWTLASLQVAIVPFNFFIFVWPDSLILSYVLYVLSLLLSSTREENNGSRVSLLSTPTSYIFLFRRDSRNCWKWLRLWLNCWQLFLSWDFQDFFNPTLSIELISLALYVFNSLDIFIVLNILILLLYF